MSIPIEQTASNETSHRFAELSENDSVIMSRIAGGDSAAFDLLYKKLSLRLQRVAWLICSDRAEAADIVQDVFFILWVRAHLYDVNRGGVYSWLATITRNRAIDWIRSRQIHSILLCEFSIDATPYQDTERYSADYIATVNDDYQVVCSALATLPGKMQHALQLTYFDRFTHNEVAAQLREPVGTIKARIRRGLVRLRRETKKATRVGD